MTNISVFYLDYHVVFYIHSFTMVCLKFLLTVRVWILCFTKIVVFYDFVHFVGKMDFVAELHPNKNKNNLIIVNTYKYICFI
ncbi:hypothetical protein Hanom_Chr14g01320581 [Helianthus anomalus]